MWTMMAPAPRHPSPTRCSFLNRQQLQPPPPTCNNNSVVDRQRHSSPQRGSLLLNRQQGVRNIESQQRFSLPDFGAAGACGGTATVNKKSNSNRSSLLSSSKEVLVVEEKTNDSIPCNNDRPSLDKMHSTRRLSSTRTSRRVSLDGTGAALRSSMQLSARNLRQLSERNLTTKSFSRQQKQEQQQESIPAFSCNNTPLERAPDSTHHVSPRKAHRKRLSALKQQQDNGTAAAPVAADTSSSLTARTVSLPELRRHRSSPCDKTTQPINNNNSEEDNQTNAVFDDNNNSRSSDTRTRSDCNLLSINSRSTRGSSPTKKSRPINNNSEKNGDDDEESKPKAVFDDNKINTSRRSDRHTRSDNVLRSSSPRRKQHPLEDSTTTPAVSGEDVTSKQGSSSSQHSPSSRKKTHRSSSSSSSATRKSSSQHSSSTTTNTKEGAVRRSKSSSQHSSSSSKQKKRSASIHRTASASASATSNNDNSKMQDKILSVEALSLAQTASSSNQTLNSSPTRTSSFLNLEAGEEPFLTAVAARSNSNRGMPQRCVRSSSSRLHSFNQSRFGSAVMRDSSLISLDEELSLYSGGGGNSRQPSFNKSSRRFSLDNSSLGGTATSRESSLLNLEAGQDPMLISMATMTPRQSSYLTTSTCTRRSSLDNSGCFESCTSSREASLLNLEAGCDEPSFPTTTTTVSRQSSVRRNSLDNSKLGLSVLSEPSLLNLEAGCEKPSFTTVSRQSSSRRSSLDNSKLGLSVLREPSLLNLEAGQEPSFSASRQSSGRRSSLDNSKFGKSVLREPSLLNLEAGQESSFTASRQSSGKRSFLDNSTFGKSVLREPSLLNLEAGQEHSFTASRQSSGRRSSQDNSKFGSFILREPSLLNLEAGQDPLLTTTMSRQNSSRRSSMGNSRFRMFGLREPSLINLEDGLQPSMPASRETSSRRNSLDNSCLLDGHLLKELSSLAKLEAAEEQQPTSREPSLSRLALGGGVRRGGGKGKSNNLSKSPLSKRTSSCHVPSATSILSFSSQRGKSLFGSKSSSSNTPRRQPFQLPGFGAAKRCSITRTNATGKDNTNNGDPVDPSEQPSMTHTSDNSDFTECDNNDGASFADETSCHQVEDEKEGSNFAVAAEAATRKEDKERYSRLEIKVKEFFVDEVHNQNIVWMLSKSGRFSYPELKIGGQQTISAAP